MDFAKAHGRRGRPSKSEFVTWKLRLEVERGLRAPARVEAAPLPEDAPPLAHHVYERFLFLLACRWLHTPGAPAPFTRKFAAIWCGVSEKQAREAIDWLRDRDRQAIVHVGWHGRMKLWLPREAAS